MKILVVMAEYPFPPKVGSGIVAYNSMKYLSNKYEIDLICLSPETNDIRPLGFPVNVELVPQKFYSKFARNLFLISSIFSIKPFWSNFMKASIDSKMKSKDYAAILLFEIHALQYCPSSSYNKVIVNIEDPLSIKFKRMLKLPVWSLWQKIRLGLLSKIVRSYERKTLPKLSKVLLLSMADVHDMHKDSHYANIGFMPYGIELCDSGEVSSLSNREKAIIFSGNMYHPPNVDGVLFFLNEVYPIILSTNPKVVFWIVGSNPDKRIYQAAEKFKEKVLITGRVESVSDYVKRATVSICPVRLNIGVQTKVLEAMSVGTPVVSTIAGNSGIGGVSGTHLWVEDNSTQFAKRVLDLLDGNSWDLISQQGLNLAKNKFSWKNSVSQLEQHIKSI